MHREDMLIKKMDNNEKLEKDLVLKAEKVKMIHEEVEQIKNAQVGELEKISDIQRPSER